MGAKARGDKIELYVDLISFHQRVGSIKNFHDLELLGLSGHDFCGMFQGSLLPKLQKFCKKNPQYHILSSQGPGRFINRLIEGSDFYMIANGDKDPTLALNYLLDPNWPVLWEDGIRSARAIIQDIKNSRQR